MTTAQDKALAASIKEAVDAAIVASENEPPRWHLGASVIGQECRRRTWYAFRWAFREVFEARILRLFNRGHREEPAIIAALRLAGIVVHAVDPVTGKQWRVRDYSGHFSGSCDAIAENIPGLPPHIRVLLEFKTSSDKYFAKVKAYGVHKGKPEHVEQMQVYMRRLGLPAALYIMVNKDDDDWHFEIVPADAAVAIAVEARALSIVNADEPPPKIGKDATRFPCAYCPAKKICHGKELPLVNCRTCAHMAIGPDATFTCAKHQHTFTKANEEPREPDMFTDGLIAPRMAEGCPDHVFNPHMLNGVEFLGGNAAQNYAELKLSDGSIVRNGPNDVPSTELKL